MAPGIPRRRTGTRKRIILRAIFRAPSASISTQCATPRPPCRTCFVGQEFARRVGALGIGDDSIIVVYDGSGLFSAARVRWTFRVFGAKDVRILEGGFPAWKAEDRPIESGPAKPRPPKVFTAHFDPAWVADADQVRDAIDRGSAQVVDARPADRFRGESPEPRPGVRPGHIPAASICPIRRSSITGS